MQKRGGDDISIIEERRNSPRHQEAPHHRGGGPYQAASGGTSSGGPGYNLPQHQVQGLAQQHCPNGADFRGGGGAPRVISQQHPGGGKSGAPGSGRLGSALPMPPGHNPSQTSSPAAASAVAAATAAASGRGRSKILNMPMPPTASPPDEDSLDGRIGGKRGGNKKKPKVIGKPPPIRMTEDGSEWGERCIDIYEIVDKV